METLGAGAAALAVGTFGFWALITVVSVLLILCTEFEKHALATFLLLATVALLGLFGDFTYLKWCTESPLRSVSTIAGYIAVGVAWSFGKWWFFVTNLRREYNDARTAFLEHHHASDMTEDLLRFWQNSDGRFQGPHFPPSARHHRARIIAWMCYWPWSCAWTIVNDPIRRLFREIYERMRQLYERIAQRAFADVADELRVREQKDLHSHDGRTRHLHP